MSNKIQLATIQFRADAKGVNPTIDAIRQSSKDAHDEVDRLEEALKKGIKVMQDANGVDFNVADRLKVVTKEAKGFDQALRELVKGATALEAVVKNIRLGEIEASSRAELKGAINAAEARKRSVRATDPESLEMQRELNIVIEESRKQLNNLDRDTQKVIDTLQNGGVVAQSVLDKEIKGLNDMLALIPKGTDEWKKYNTQLQTIETEVASIRKKEQEAAASLLGKKDLGRFSEDDIRSAIISAKELLATYKTASPEAKVLADNIVRAEQFLKQYGIEAARVAAREAQQIQTEKDLAVTMNKRLRDLKNLSAEALAETRRYWEEQMNGAAKGTAEFKKAEDALKKIDGQLRNRKVDDLTTILGDPSKFGISEVRNAVQEMEKLRDSVMQGIPAWHKYNNAAEQGREYLAKLDASRISEQMRNLSSLSASGLQEVKRYWETMVAGAERGTLELDRYEAELKEVVAEERARATEANKDKAGILGSNLGRYSEEQIRQAIEAGNQLIKTYPVASAEAQRLAKNIVAAEDYLKQYGLEAEHAAQREREALKRTADQRAEMNQAMIQQLNDYHNITPEILKAQEQYWQKLINDPKTARDSLDAYKNILEQVHKMQEAMIQSQGQSALNFFRGDISNASAADIKKKADALKVYRDSLPGQSNAALIQEIDGYLAKVGKTAKTTTEEMKEEVMDLAEAMNVASNAGKTAMGVTESDKREMEWLREERKFIKEMMSLTTEGSDAWKDLKGRLNEVNDQLRRLPFSRTTEDLKAAQKALEDAIATTDKGTPKYDRLRMALSRIKAEMAGAGISAQKTQEVLANPKAEKNIDTLKNAVARARGELDVMGQRIERMQRLLTQAEKDGNKKWAGRLREAIKQTTKSYDELAASTKNADQAQKELAATAKGTATAFDKAWSRLKTYIGLYVGAAVAMQKLTATMGDLMDLSDKMGEVRKTTGFSADEVGRLSENLKKLDVRTALPQLMEVAAAAGQLGLKTEEDVQGFTEAANKLMIALPEMGKEAATEMMRVAIATGEVEKIRKQMEEGLIKGSSATAVAMEKIASTIDRLRASSASTAPEITDFVKRVGAVGAQSGITIDQVSALGSTISSLGMRVEMSATAISRMIPAIKNNAFDIARAIGVTPETVRNLFDTGKGMEAVLLILQHMKDAGMDEDSIEAMMGVGGMKDVMKDLNQQGARAGIVFAGLSQNVDELRRQLVVANQAYEENIAIQNEFDKMNQTVAARWERLKNQVEELFVGDAPQKWLGGIIDGLRWIIDFITGPMRRAFYILIAVLATYRIGLGEALISLKDYLLNIGKTAESVKKWFTELNKANIWGAILAGAAAAAYAVYDWIDSMKEAAREAARFEAELMKEQMKVENLTTAIGKARAKTEDANKEVEEARKTLDAAKKSTDKTRESTERLTKAETDLISKEEKKRNAMAESQRLIEQFNTDYGKYLGFMLSEISSNIELAQARELVNDKLRETITLKRKEAALERVEKEMGESRDDAYADLWDFVQRKATSKDANGKQVADPTKAAKVLNALTRAAQNDKADRKAFEKTAKDIFKANGIENYDVLLKRASNYFDELDKIRKKNKVVEQQFDAEESGNREKSQKDLNRQYKAAVSNYEKLEKDYSKATGEAKKKAAANLLKQMDTLTEMVDSSGRYYKMEDEQEKKDYDTFIKNADKRVNGMKAQREKLLKEAGNAYKPRKDANGNITTSIETNPWGGRQPAESTNYADMNAEALVTRRKQMKDFVNAIQTDSDVKGVLAEDKALQKAIENGMSSDMRTVIEWYNTERLKIQDELHARHLTNTGDWMDPKKQKNRHKQFKAEMQAYLEELDAYYTERKTEIENARNDEEITEGEAWRRNIKNEAEWHQRRAELQKMYSDKAVQVTEKEQDAIRNIIAERTGDDTDFIQKSIEKTKKFAEMVRQADARGEAEFRKWMADLGLGWEKDYLKEEKAIGKQVKFMADTLAKERPLNGIVEDLELTLSKMGILSDNVPEKTRFLIDQLEDAYTIDIKELVDRMSKAGFKEWAKQIEGDTTMQQALLAQLRKAYESVQDAIRKEASRIKKDADMMWKLMLTPDGKNLKQITDEALSKMTQQQDSLGRANSLIGSGVASENVATRLAIRQLRLQLSIQKAQFALMRKMGEEKAQYLEQLAKEYEIAGRLTDATRASKDADNVRKSINLAITEETKNQAELLNQIAKEQEEAQNRLYQNLREWADLFASGLQQMFEASHAGDAEYYNELAKLNLTGKGGSGAGTYVVIDNEGTSKARAHYEYLDEREALEREHEIERQNAQAEAWKKLWDDINNKMSEQITDWINAMLQNQSIDANTAKVSLNTDAVNINTEASRQSTEAMNNLKNQLSQGIRIDSSSSVPAAGIASAIGAGEAGQTSQPDTNTQESTNALPYQNAYLEHFFGIQKASKDALKTVTDNDRKMAASAQSTFAKMTLAANMYGIAYQAMSNENLSATQKFEMMALQAVGNYAIGALTTEMASASAKAATDSPGVLGKLWKELGWAAAPVFAIFTGLLGGLMGLASSKIGKAKSQIAQATGASVGAGRLSTGMLTYAEGNVNEFTDPGSLTPGRSYNVDAADGRTYRAKYTGSNPGTHLTNGPEFHLAGEKGREMIIDAGTTRQITMNERDIWHAIKTLSSGGRMSRGAVRRGGMPAFADGNMDEFADYTEIAADGTVIGGMNSSQAAAFQQSLDRNNELLERALSEGIKGVFNVYGSDGLVASYDKGKKTLIRHGEKH